MRFSKAVVKYRVAILIVALVLLVPAVFGMTHTRINYDMLDYLPEDMGTVIGQNELLNDFGKGAFSLVIVENMPAKDVAALKEKIAAVEHVDSVVWYDSLADLRLPMELLPDSLYEKFNTENATLMAVFFDSATSEDVTMDAIREIRSLAGQQCFVTGMSALVTDLKDLCEQEEPIYVALAVACACAAMMLLLDGWLVPFVFLASIGMAIVYNLGSNFFLGEISYITKALSAVLQLADLTDDLESLFVGFGTGVGEIHAAHAGHLGDQLFRELDGGDVADAVGEVAHFHHLLGDGVDDFLAAVADVDGPHAAGHGVKIGLAVDVGDAHPFALHINGGLEILVLGQVVPNVLFVQSDQFSFIVSHGAFLMK